MRYTARARRAYYRFRRAPRSPRRPALNESKEEGTATATRIERTYDAPIETIWELWTTPSGIEAWWAPDGFTTEVQTLDLVPNGELVYTMTATGPEQVEFMRGAGMPLTTESRKRFTEIEAPTRLAYSSLADFIPGVDPYEFMTVVELDSVAGGTHVVMRMDALHDDTWTERLIMGRENELDNLATLIARR
jgi:uncharacterized protein YndB with AHSA1/START domain